MFRNCVETSDYCQSSASCCNSSETWGEKNDTKNNQSNLTPDAYSCGLLNDSCFFSSVSRAAFILS